MILKSILIIISIIIWVAYLALRYMVQAALGIQFIPKVKINQIPLASIILDFEPLIAALAIITIAILKSLEFVNFSLWWITIPVIFDLIITAITIFIIKKFY